MSQLLSQGCQVTLALHGRLGIVATHDRSLTQVQAQPGGPRHSEFSRQLGENIFHPFVTTKQKGTGLGLATCHSIVTEHGGSIDVETALGKGTKMIVRIPAVLG